MKGRKAGLNQEGDSGQEEVVHSWDSGKLQNYFGSAECSQQLVLAGSPVLPTIRPCTFTDFTLHLNQGRLHSYCLTGRGKQGMKNHKIHSHPKICFWYKNFSFHMHFSQVKHIAILISILIQHSASGYFEVVFFIKHSKERGTTYTPV